MTIRRAGRLPAVVPASILNHTAGSEKISDPDSIRSGNALAVGGRGQIGILCILHDFRREAGGDDGSLAEFAGHIQAAAVKFDEHLA